MIASRISVALLGDDRDRGVFLDAVQQEVERLGRGDIGQNRIETLLDAQEKRGAQEDDDVQPQDDVADAKDVASLADQERRDVGAVQDGAAAHGQPHSRSEEETAEDGGQQLVGRDVGKMNGRKADRTVR